MINIDWQKVSGLLPVIVQEDSSNEILMLAYMNEEALDLSLKTGYAHYFSRTKNRIWKKGEESGNTQKIISASLDCDNDTLLLKVIQNGGAACHTGAKSCFFNQINLQNLNIETKKPSPSSQPSYDIIDELYHVVLERKLNANPESSYVAKLFSKGENAILKKVGEEATEFVMAGKDVTRISQNIASTNERLDTANQKINKILSQANTEVKDELSILDIAMLTDEIVNLNKILQKNKEDMVYEAADLYFHTIVALAMHNIHPERIKTELARRFGLSGIDEKNSRQS
ncbi:bifunctional phosphoribosyl-AMP cyclohydrolase/phosphoribosyl-ATP diphosphatase HisIE [Campylobacter suis]|uniref:Histidine biosynthesis bifunctional protein HisIE n=1 Tax=Campylobacter suis TaxID=2790657 RepID=A0ABN7K7E1_9BACT|nr:bifunctional phosphoribosyl-AMP cyclohydrolase/phosphoribosyl-ATP diphosphatase HisIE [Campylobacter suis]CAD7287879.1 Histidine biosynthesis bifunctional protein HisIE [Campylobacter suis]